MNVKQSITFRSRIIFVLLAVFALAITIRIVHIQFWQGSRWKRLAKENLLRYRIVKATRGNIFSDNGSLLATSLPLYRVAFDPMAASSESFKKSVDSLSILLAGFFKDKSALEYKRMLIEARADKSRFKYINKSFEIDYQEKKKMSYWPLFRLGRMKGGAIFEKIEKREYPFKSLAFRTIGYLNEDQGGVGLEYSFNRKLAGVNGESLFRKLQGGNWRPVYDGTEIRPLEGLDIQTTIDINLQDVAETALEKALRQHQADFGCVVVMEVKTGMIKAIANLQTNGMGSYIENYNYAVKLSGDPGSTFKLASYMALFEQKVITPNDTIQTGGGRYSFYDRVMTDSKPGGYGRLTVREAFAQSSNIAVSKLVTQYFGIEPAKFIEYLAKFGLTAPLNFQLMGESKPYIKKTTDPEWSGTSLPWMSIGYETSLSPLQILTFYNAVANQGKMIQPIIVTKILQADEVVEEFEPYIIREQICSQATLDMLRPMLEQVIENGTASNIKNENYKIAGKTGTTQKLINGKYSQSYSASFCGYFPAEEPKYSCFVLIDDPKGYKIYGSDVAAPVFKEIADKVYARDIEMFKTMKEKTETDFPRSRNEFPLIRAGNFAELSLLCNQFGISNHLASPVAQDEEESKNLWVRADLQNNAVTWRQAGAGQNRMPDVRGMSLRDALFLLENKKLQVSCNGRGSRIKSQSIGPNQTIRARQFVSLQLD